MRETKFQIFDATPQDIGGQRMYTWEEYCAELAEDFPLHAILSGEVSDLVPLEFTGLKDKNGKGAEIYEGDVVYLAGYGDYIVEFPFTELYEAGMEKDIGAILGNTHENPELLDGSK